MKFPKSVTTPAICRDGDDFAKLLLAFCLDPPGDMPFLTFAAGVRQLLHEYLALVLRGDIEPYKDTPNESTVKDFRELASHITQLLIQEDPTMIKEVDGRMTIDFDGIFQSRGRDPKDSFIRSKE